MARVKKHTHKYQRVYLGRDKSHEVFACADSECSHHVEPALVIGRKSICHVCDGEMVIFKHPKNRIPNKPHHKECTRKKDKSHVKPVPISDVEIEKIFEDILEG